MTATDQPVCSARNHWLDAVRGVAVMRVVVWHTFATAFLSWTISTMPAMFFVAGSLLAHSLDKRPFEQLLRTRLKRLLIPYWVLGGLLLTVLALVHRADGTAITDMSTSQFFAWIFPLLDPRGSAWEAGWIASPLWYLRCYLWLLLLSPLYRSAQRRWGLGILAVPLAAVFVVDVLIRHPELAPAAFTDAKWYVGDLATYSFFLILGFGHHDGLARTLSRRDRLEWAGIGLAAGVLWITLVDVPGNIVNNSYPMLLFIGIAWLAFFLAFEPEMARLQTARLTAPVMNWIGRRAMTVYLWHTTAIVFGYWVLATFAPETNRLMVLPLAVIGIVVLTAAFGWVEDVAAGKPAEWWPGRPMPQRLRAFSLDRRGGHFGGVAVGAVMSAILVGFVVGGAGVVPGAAVASAAGDLNLPPAPSAKPAEAIFEPEGERVEMAPRAVVSAEPGDSAVAERVQAVIDAWRVDQGIDGMYLGVSLPSGEQVLLTSGTAADGSALSVTDDWPITSVTKTMTSAIIMSLVDDGTIALDDVIPDLDVLPGYPFAGQVTYRQLLMHTSGITTYKETEVYTAERRYEDALSVVDALEMSATEPLAWAPGTQVGYSSSGYLTLGAVAAQLTGQTYEELLQTRVFGPAGMTASSLDTEPYAGWIGDASGGVKSTLGDLLSWGDALYRARTVVSDASVEAIIDIDNPFSAGLGSYPVCPCVLDEDGNKVVASIGHNGGEATVQWSHADDLVIAAAVTESWTDERTQSHIGQLLLDVRNAVAGSPS